MNYKEIHDELLLALLGDNEKELDDDIETGIGVLCDIYNPFDNDCRREMTKEQLNLIRRLVNKYAAKLYLDTKDEYAVKTLVLLSEMVGEIYMRADIPADYYGTDLDPEYMVNCDNLDKTVEPTKEEAYKVTLKTNTTSEEKKFYFKELAEAYLINKKNSRIDVIKGLVGEEEFNKLEMVDEEDHFKLGDYELTLSKMI